MIIFIFSKIFSVENTLGIVTYVQRNKLLSIFDSMYIILLATKSSTNSLKIIEFIW